MYKITYQVRTYLQMEQMGLGQWQKCLGMARPVVEKIRKVMACVAQEDTSGWEQDKDFQQWVADEELKYEREGKPDKALAMRDATNATKVLKDYASWLKTTLPGACFQAADFALSTGTKKYNKGRRGRWREQAYAYLSGLVVIDVDHCGNPRELFERISKEHDLKASGILMIYVSARGEGLKIVFKARPEWSNLICQQYEMASLLGILDFVDDSCKDSSRLSYLTSEDDVLYVDTKELFSPNPIASDMEDHIARNEYDLQYGDRYRQAPKGDSSPLMQKWIDFENQRKDSRRKKKTGAAPKAARKQEEAAPAPVEPAESTVTFTERDEALVKAFNEYYGPSLPSGQRHPRFTEETSHWMCWVCDNDPVKAIAMSYRLDYVKNWHPRTGEVEDLINTAAKKKLLTRCPKALKELLVKAGIDKAPAAGSSLNPDDELPYEEWIEQIRGLFDVYPCVREICEPHPEKLWLFLLFAAAAFIGTDMTLCWWYFYDQPEKMRRLNYNVLGVGDPSVGKAPLERIENLLTEAIDQADKMVNDATNNWKEEHLSKGVNKDKKPKPKGIVRKHGARTSNNVFINDMVNAVVEVDGEMMHEHMLTTDSEAINSIKMQKGGSWIDKQVMEIKAWSNERDSQQYSNMESVTGPFNVYWNQVRTCTPPALKMLVNERNFGSGYPLRLYVLPVPDKGFEMIPLRRKSQKALDADEVIRQWGYRMDKRRGELPVWSLVEHSWHWTNDHMEIAGFNEDKADRLLLKRCAVNGLCIAIPWVDMRHWEERELTGTYQPDEQDMALLDLVLDIQYKTQRHYFYELACNYFDEQLKDATTFRRRTTRFQMCFQQLPDEFNTKQFSTIFGYANNRSACKAIDRLLSDKAIERTKRGEYRKRVKNIN